MKTLSQHLNESLQINEVFSKKTIEQVLDRFSENVIYNVGKNETDKKNIITSVSKSFLDDDDEELSLIEVAKISLKYYDKGYADQLKPYIEDIKKYIK